MDLTIYEIAKLAGVSRSTVSRVITGNENVKASTREHVERVVAEFGYRPNSIARGLVKGSLDLVGLMVGDIRNPFYSEIARGVQDVAGEFGYLVVLYDTDYLLKRERLFLEAAQQHGFSGLILLSALDEKTLMPLLADFKGPIVLLNRYIQSFITDVVLVDNFLGGYIAGQYLTELGHKNIGYLAGPQRSTASRERGEGFLKAIHDAGAQLESDLVIYGDLRMSTGYEYGKRWIKKKRTSTAVFAANDLMALGIMKAFIEFGIIIPNDVSIMGYDDLSVSELAAVPLTTVRQPQYEMGVAAMSRLVQRMKGNVGAVERKVYKPELVVRNSTTWAVTER